MTSMSSIRRLLSDDVGGVVDQVRRPPRSGAKPFSRLPRRILYLVALLLVFSGLMPFVASQGSSQASQASDIAAQPSLPTQATGPSGQASTSNSHSASPSSDILTICHIPTGAPWNMRTITVNSASAGHHLDHGDTLGSCDFILEPEPDSQPGLSGGAPGHSGDAHDHGHGQGGSAPGNNGNHTNAGGDGQGPIQDGPAPGAGPSPSIGPTDKVAICHVPPGNPDNARTIHVADASISAHLGHGDSLGACPSEDTEPVATFTYQTDGLNVTFDGSSSYDPDGGDIVDHDWSFGDGNSTGGPNASVTHTYADNGTYWVTLTVTDDEGDEGVTTQRVQVNANTVTICHVPPGNPDAARTIRVAWPALSAHLAHGDTRGACDDGDGPTPTVLKPVAGFDWTCEALACEFNASTSHHPDPNRTITNWTWTVNPTFYGEVVDHTFDAAGTYDVTLVVTDDNGVSSDPLTLAVDARSGGGGGGGGGDTITTGGGGGQAPTGDDPGDGEIVPTGGPTGPTHPDPTIVPTGGPDGPPGIPFYGAGVGPIEWGNWQAIGGLFLMLLGGAGLLVAPASVPGLKNMHWMDRLYFQTPHHAHHQVAATMHTPMRGALDVHGEVNIRHPPASAGAIGAAPHQSGAWGSGFA